MFNGLVDSFAYFCLKFGHITVVLPVVLVCMIFCKRDIYAKAACFLLWVMIFNTLLKYLFKVPLFPHLGAGYAFPSGHMHASAAFYGYILYRTDNKILKVALAALLCCIGFSLIHCHFHDLKDVLGAVGFTIFELTAYHIISKNFGDKIVGIIAVISAVAVMFTLNIIHKIEFHVWLAFYGLIGTEVSMLIMPKNKLNELPQKFFALATSSLLIWGGYQLFEALAFEQFYLSETRFALVPLIIIGSIKLAERIKFEI